MTKILLLGNGAREHAIGAALKKSGAQVFTFADAKNPGLLEVSESYETASLKDFEAIKNFTKKIQPDFAFIGPDDPIADGVADLLLDQNIQSVAPLKTVARIESSKGFTRNLLTKYNIPGNPRYQVFTKPDGMSQFLTALGDTYVVKADGLFAGKGVKVSGDHLHSHQEALDFAMECLEKFGQVVIEEKLIGQEFSLMSFCDGYSTALMPAVQDHKRALAGDKGPNTGGMGSYSDANHSLPFLNEKDISDAHNIIQKVSDALFTETGVRYQGILYGGFIAVKDGVKVIEFNARFGDPEALNVLPILETNFVDLCKAIIHHDLKSLPVIFANKATVCKYIVPQGYPDNPVKGAVLKPSDVEVTDPNIKLYFRSVDKTPEGLRMGSSRTLAYVGIADSLAKAEILAETACQKLKGPVFYRSDIGKNTIIKEKIAMMEHLREHSI